MLRRSLAALATAVSAAAVVAVPLAPAHAEGSCTFTPPARIAIYADYTELPANITGDCVPDGSAFWFTAMGDDDDEDFAAAVLFGGEDGDRFIDVPDVLDRYGRQKWEAAGAISDSSCQEGGGGWWRSARTPETIRSHARAAESARAEDECNELTQNEPFSDIRLGTYGAISGTRNTANKVTFTVTSAIWSTGLDKLINRSMKGVLQTQYADGTWHNVGGTITTASNGKSTFSVGLPRRTWRFAVYSTPYSFDRVSTAVTR